MTNFAAVEEYMAVFQSEKSEVEEALEIFYRAGNALGGRSYEEYSQAIGKARLNLESKLNEAERRLSSVDYSDHVELHDVRVCLERGIEFLVGKCLCRIKDKDCQDRTQRVLDSDALMAHWFLFDGEMQSVFFKYRERQHVLTLKRKNELLNAIAKSAKEIVKAVDELNSHGVVEYSLSANERRSIAGTLKGLDELRSTYDKLLGDADEVGINDLLREGYNQVRLQFTDAVVHICLRYYGHIPPVVHERLLQEKSTTYLFSEGLPGDGGEREAHLKVSYRHRRRAREKAKRMAETGGWVMLPVINEYRHHSKKVDGDAAEIMRG